MKVALISDWLVNYAGSEKVENEILSIFPNADIYTCVYDKDKFIDTNFENKNIKESFIKRLPRASRYYQKYLPLLPFAVEQFDLSDYDLIISSSHAVAKGVLTGPNQLHICYCHSPMRYAWDLQHQYLAESNMAFGLKGVISRYLLHRIRIWDYRTSNGVDYFISNSNYIARRIKKVYGRDATTIYPNVAVEKFDCQEHKDNFYLTASRLVPYKKIDLIVRAFANMPDKKLIVIGDGPQMYKVSSFAASNITIMGYQDFEVLKDYMKRAKAFVFAAEEDFGIIPVEAQACGTPVIAYAKGGASETVIDKVTGLLFNEQSEISIENAVREFEKDFITDSKLIREHAENFSTSIFRVKFKEFVESKYNQMFG